MTDPLTLTGSQFLTWLQQHVRDHGHTIRSREESARDRGMQVVPENLATADAFAALDDMIAEMLAIGSQPMIKRIVQAGRVAVGTETATRKGQAAA